MKGRILAVDPGEKRLGIAVSDPSGTIARPLSVIKHISREIDAAAIAQVAIDHGVSIIIIGWALDSNGFPGPQARKASRLADAIIAQTNIPVYLWDESGSTQAVRDAWIEIGSRKKHRRKGMLDALAATVILQTYLDTQAD